MSQPILYIECFYRQRLATPTKPFKKRYYFRIRAANGEPICGSEAYTTSAKRNKTARLLASAKFEIT